MELTGKHVVVTGAASGIGRAMALPFAREGARAVVVTDINNDGLISLAAEIGTKSSAEVLTAPADVADADQVIAVIERAESSYGVIDLYCANAGIGGGAGLTDTTDEEWRQAFDVNVFAHVVAARRLVPTWVERGDGYFLSTASAAGLLSVVGCVPYAVTKHGAVAFAEWLAFTYGDRGVKVSCLCPMGVRTPLLENGLEQPGELGLGTRMIGHAGPILEPAQVADAVIAGVASEKFLILPHPEVQQMFTAKASDHDKWIAGLQWARSALA